MPTSILGIPRLNAYQLASYVQRTNPNAPDLAADYLRIANGYGIRGDIAFAQALHETDYFRFTGDVKPEQNNFAGIGAIGNGARGASFPTPQAGIEGQMQHLYAYASTAPLPSGKTATDPRFNLVRRGIAPNWEDLSGKWAADPAYADKILHIYNDMVNVTDGHPFPDVPETHWAYPYVVEAQHLGLMKGTETGEFLPDQTATRAELAVVLVNLYDILRKNQP